MQVRRALVGSYSEAVLVCMYVCIHTYKLTCSLRTFLVRASHDAIAMEIEDSENRRQCQNESRDMEDS